MFETMEKMHERIHVYCIGITGQACNEKYREKIPLNAHLQQCSYLNASARIVECRIHIMIDAFHNNVIIHIIFYLYS